MLVNPFTRGRIYLIGHHILRPPVGQGLFNSTLGDAGLVLGDEFIDDFKLFRGEEHVGLEGTRGVFSLLRWL